MNKLIEKLAEQCISIPNHLNPPVFNQEKFAELIVKECLNNCMAANDRDRIKEHFGVAE
jgi:hypothetical protein